jgi:ribosomal protein S21
MLKVVVKNSNIESALKELKSKVIKTKQIQELNKRKNHTKNSVVKRDKIKKSIYKNKLTN